MTREQAQRILSRFDGLRVLVVGDLMIDEYIWGHASRVSPEAPVLVLDAAHETFVPGGAANVAKQIVDLGASVVVAGAVGEDAAAERLKAELGKMGADTAAVVTANDRPTTQKTRIVAGTQQLVRVDRENRAPLPAAAAAYLLRQATAALESCDALLFSDYDKGVLTRETVRALVGAARAKGVAVTANPKSSSARSYADIDVAQLNRTEADQSARAYALPGTDPFESPDAETFHDAGKRLRTALGVGNLLVTRSADGLTVFHADDGYTDVPAHRVEVYDGTGAGDSTIAGLTLALASGTPLLDAVAIGNAAGGAVVRKVGVVTANREEIAALFP
jgi:D-beta-D-heptose 7-phosphate kinase/D-beta-D-heptose 1-phosphate adenosyltransferase